jgi:hypothetical protein
MVSASTEEMMGARKRSDECRKEGEVVGKAWTEEVTARRTTAATVESLRSIVFFWDLAWLDC